MSSCDRFIVGEWVVDPDLDRISRGCECVDLPPQAMDLLVFLASNHGEVVSNDTLLDALWADRVVTTASLYSIIKQLRHALGDDAHNPRYIQTVHAVGYRFVP